METLDPMNAIVITFGNQPSLWWLVAGGVAVLALLWWSVRTARGAAGTRRKGLLLALRLLVVALVVFCLLDPHIREEVRALRPGHVAVLLDTSRSMEITEAGVTRLQQALDWLAQSPWPAGIQARLYAFDDDLADLPRLEDARTGGRRTALMEALARVADMAEAEPVSSILVVSDGADTGSKRGGDAGARLARWNIPVHAVLTGSTNPPPDVWIEGIQAPLVADRRTAIHVSAKLHSPGFAGRSTLLHVSRDDRRIISREIRLSGGPQREDLRFAATNAGFHVFTVEIEPLPGERLPSNNRREFGVTVTDLTLRVIYMEATSQGRAGDKPEIFYLKHALEDEPGIEVKGLHYDQRGVTSPAVLEQTAFLDPRTGERIYRVQNSRRGYPKSMDELLRYHVIISSDIPRTAFETQQMEDTVRFVEEFGGGFVMVGGDTSFGAGLFDQTPLEKILPVEMAESRDNLYETFNVQIPAGAFEHPIMRLMEDTGANLAAWDKLPPFMGFNQVDRPKPGATVLWQHPTDQNRYGPRPILVVQQIGKGRSMAFATDTTHSWGDLFEKVWGEPADPAGVPSQANNDGRYYKQFWVNSVRWLSARRFQKEQLPVALSARSSANRPREPIPFTAAWLDSAPPDSAKVRAELWQGERLVESPALEWQSASNLWRGSARPDAEGAFRLRFTVDIDEAGIREVNQLLDVRERDQELEDVRARVDTLGPVVRETGGTMLTLDSPRTELAALLTGARAETVRHEKRPLWDSWIWLALIVGLLVSEWIVRRTSGLA